MTPEIKKYANILRNYIQRDYREMYREPGGVLPYGFLTPGSASYPDVLWDWDSYFSDVALKQILLDTETDPREALDYERGCVLNFLALTDEDGYMPISVTRHAERERLRPINAHEENMHKPVLAQHAAFLAQSADGDIDWLRSGFPKLQRFLDNYLQCRRHRETGLLYWNTDKMIGVDNDPCTFYRPDNSSASIYLNCLMVKELEAMTWLCDRLGQSEAAIAYERERQALIAAIQAHCYDERDGFFYNVDLNLRKVDFSHGEYYHKGMPRHWDCLIQRIDVWSGFMALWAGVATEAQAERVVQRYRDERSFNCAAGVRTLSRLEKMYRVVASNNPSCWLGPVWGIANYLTFRGLMRYGYSREAQELCEKTIRLLGRDVESSGVMHEYYDPDSGAPIINPGFQNWNMLVLNMIDFLEAKETVWEF